MQQEHSKPGDAASVSASRLLPRLANEQIG